MGVPEVRPGDPIRASQWNEIVRRLLLSIRAGTGLTATHTGNVLTFALAPTTKLHLFVARIVNQGPAAEADYTDQRYWIREVTPIYGATPSWENITATGAYYVTASYLGELTSKTHSLPVDGTQLVLAVRQFDNSVPSVPTYSFIAALRLGFWVRLTGETGAGVYSGKRLKDDGATDYVPAQAFAANVKEVNGTAGISVHAATGTVVWVWPDETDDPTEWRFELSLPLATPIQVVKIVSYGAGVYVVQPVVRSGAAWANDGGQLADIHNYGEVQADEAGYLAGPGGCDIYVPLFTAGDESFILVHPPRMV